MLGVIAVLLISPVLSTAPQEPGVPRDARAVIAAANADWIPALKVGDATRIAAPYADDGIFVTATGIVVKGRDAIEQLMRERVAAMGKVLGGELMQDGLIEQGSLIYEWGHANLELAREAGSPVHSGGRYLTVWKKGPTGRWEITRNLSLPN